MIAASRHILLVDDDPGDAGLTKVALRQSASGCAIHHVGDGREAMEFLRREGVFRDVPIPHLVLLDLNMPRMDGRQVLDAMRSDPDLKVIPVVILTTSDAEADIEAAYALGANSFVTKPPDFNDFCAAIAQLAEFWLGIARIPY